VPGFLNFFFMAKKSTHIKDPKKVAAGKARAANAIKDSSGRYVSRILYNEIAKITLAVKGIDVSKISGEQTQKITSLMSEAKVSAKEVKNLYENNPVIFEAMINEGKITGTNKNSNQLEKSISDYTGQIIINGEERTQAEAKKDLMSFKQYITANFSVVDFTIKPSLSFDGKMILNIPDVKEILKHLKEHFELSSIKDLAEIDPAEITEALQEYFDDHDEYDIVMYASGKKK